MGSVRAADFDDCIVQSQGCAHLSTPRSQGYLGAVARAKNVRHQHHHAVGAKMSSATSSSRFQEKQNININTHNLILLAFDANVKEPFVHTTLVWAMEHALKRGDTLVIVVVCASVRGPLGYRVKMGDEKWQSATRALAEHEIRQKSDLWIAFPGLQYRCIEDGVKLLLAVKAAQQPEVAIVREAVTFGATHVVLDKSLKNRRRKFYVENLSCGMTRMRKSGGVEVVRVAKVVENYRPSSSPTSVLTPVRYDDDELDVLETFVQSKRTSTSRSAPSMATFSMQNRRSSNVSQPVTTGSSSNATDYNAAIDEDDLVSIFQFGSQRHDTEFIDSILLNTRNPRASEYDSDEPSITTTKSSSHEPLSPTFISRLAFVEGLGECVEIHLQGALREGEGLLVGASPSALFLLQQGSASSRVVTIGALATYIAMEGGMMIRLAHLESDQHILAVDLNGRARTIAVGHAITQPQPLLLVEASNGNKARRHSVILNYSQSACLRGDAKSLCVKSLKVGDKVLLRLKCADQPWSINF